jgi:hypothetical protein
VVKRATGEWPATKIRWNTEKRRLEVSYDRGKTWSDAPPDSTQLSFVCVLTGPKARGSGWE